MERFMYLAVFVLLFVPMTVSAQVDHASLPDPSFYEFSEWNHRYPDRDVNVDLYKHSWMDSDKFIGHGGFIEATYLTPGDPLNPPAPGAVLKYLKAYNHGMLEAGNHTNPTVHNTEQVFFYILSGNGEVESGGKSAAIREGSGVFVPAKVEYMFRNTGNEPVNAVIIVEDITPDFKPQTEIKVGNFHDNPVADIGMHWVNTWYSIVDDVEFCNPMGIGIVTVPPQEIQQPHVHNPGTEEIWCKTQGDCLIMFGKVLRWHREGEAYLVPPTGKDPHMAINNTDQPSQWLYIGNRHDERVEIEEPTNDIHPSPLPSFSEFSAWNHRYPTDPDIDMYLHHWKDSDLEVGHGGFIERAVLTKGDPIFPTKPGAVLKYLKSYNHADLEANCSTQKVKYDKEQSFFFVLKGEGRVEASGKSERLWEGSGVFMPAGLEYQFFNTTDTNMELVIVTEIIGDEAPFDPLPYMSVGNYHNSLPATGMHWAHIARDIVPEFKFYNPLAFAAVSIDPFDIAQPHLHIPGTEEIWYMVTGTSLNFFGKQLRMMEPGTGFLVPPNERSIQCSINHTDEPMMWLYMGLRRDKYEPGNEQRGIEQGFEAGR